MVSESVSVGLAKRDPLSQLLSDCELIALWETRASVRAVDLDPESRLRREEREGDDGRERRRERALRAGSELALRLARVEGATPREGAVIRWLVERAGPARVTVVATSRWASLGTGLHELVGRSFARPEVVKAWTRSGELRLAAAAHGRRLLDLAASAWGVTTGRGLDQQDDLRQHVPT